jgi:hypothetical protein
MGGPDFLGDSVWGPLLILREFDLCLRPTMNPSPEAAPAFLPPTRTSTGPELGIVIDSEPPRVMSGEPVAVYHWIPTHAYQGRLLPRSIITCCSYVKRRSGSNTCLRSPLYGICFGGYRVDSTNCQKTFIFSMALHI